MKKIVMLMIRFYQKFISPLKPPTCIYTPTCSEYTYRAVQKFGVLKGLFLGFRRVLRCNPLYKGGEDPVPDEFYIIRRRRSS
ncbi:MULTISPECIES: membrane protein insertion efficiency factor YidD [unclassified Thermosipho (in: thermotogales)]|uniref:membrane protein insertion efficiency factor YidD n=1 Tax=unclassified Thermosipho (in: thermotogales) TaxID=2676525 RepID=UPI000987AB77|nr:MULTISPECIES: membrane protein insertion efficiency factor YidD [unclassified Thermosipho (in: thermotogales)]MBT1248289.1 membrane protein insertion efficiency factor [Thermosipho sp. 1244]OOC45480.1 membrane protein insertion efficiency factor [Thermosipho sp. 1223]